MECTVEEKILQIRNIQLLNVIHIKLLDGETTNREKLFTVHPVTDHTVGQFSVRLSLQSFLGQKLAVFCY